MVIRTRMPIPDGWNGARCRQLVITPDDDPPYNKDQQADMLEFCNEPEPCPIRAACLSYAMVNNCTHGVWGGMSPEDRRAMRRRYPLGLGVRNEKGTLEYHPRPEWKWLPPGGGLALLTIEEQAETDAAHDWAESS